jgi:hypothetical protein
MCQLTVEEADISDGKEFSVQVLRRADIVDSSCEGCDDTVGSAGRVLGVEVSVSGFSVDGDGSLGRMRTSRKGKYLSGEGCPLVKLRSSVKELRKER